MTEILDTLKEADKRYSHNVTFLAGGKDKATQVTSETQESKNRAKKKNMLDNVPPGI
jgi:hypothetical protein